jgi:hypothetical protein
VIFENILLALGMIVYKENEYWQYRYESYREDYGQKSIE